MNSVVVQFYYLLLCWNSILYQNKVVISVDIVDSITFLKNGTGLFQLSLNKKDGGNFSISFVLRVCPERDFLEI